MRKQIVYIGIAIIVIIILVSVGLYLFYFQSPTYTTKVSLPGSSVVQAPFLLADQKGFFKAEELNVTLVQAGAAATQSLIAGEVEFTNAPSAALSSGLKGADIKIVAICWAAPHYDLVARPDVNIKTVTDLKGKSIGLTSPGDIGDYLFRMILAKNGLDPNKDVKISYLSTRVDVAAQVLEKGDVDAAMLNPQLRIFYTFKKGYVLVAQSKDYVPTYAAAGLVTTSKVIKEHPEVVKRMVTALSEAVKYIHENRNATVQFFLKQYPTLLDEALAEKLYDTYRDSYKITLDPKTIEVTLDVEASAQGLTNYPPAETYLDDSFI